MIPRKIHYVWLSNEKKPPLVQRCIESWRRIMPDYEIKCWTAADFGMDSIVNTGEGLHHHWLRETIAARKWSWATDYIRHLVLYREGGIYLDSDVYIKKRFDDFLPHDFFTGVEYNEQKFAANNQGLLNDDGTKKDPASIIQGLTIQAAIIGSRRDNKMLADMMAYYDNNHFIDGNGNYNYAFLAPDVMAFALETYGFRYRDEYQDLGGGAVIYPTAVFASGIKQASKGAYAIHMYSSMWKEYSLIGALTHKAKTLIKTWALRK